ncbi:uncharacterized protein TNCV_4240631 [Trichonephila clavipes]|nr:uncharacterized protein TNCV_4240631 [Trichonephila clavipes]
MTLPSGAAQEGSVKLNTILNLTLEGLHLWCIENNMTVNLKKTTCQFFTLNDNHSVPNWFITILLAFCLQALSNYNENNCLRVCRTVENSWERSSFNGYHPTVVFGEMRGQTLGQKGNGESFRLTASRVARDNPWSTLCKKSHGIPSSPRAAAVAKFRLLTGHDCFCAHLFRFNLVTSPICVLCDTGQDMTAAHLDECSALNDLNCIVKRYWRARCLMT